MMRTRRAKTDPPGAAIGPSIVLEGVGGFSGQDICITRAVHLNITLHVASPNQSRSKQCDIQRDGDHRQDGHNHLIIIKISILITYQEERKIQAVTVMRLRMWATSPWGGHNNWYALDMKQH